MLKKDQVCQKILAEIESGTFLPGAKLPSGIELARKFEVSHITMRSALHELVLSGKLDVVHGRGIFVRNNQRNLLPKLLIVRGRSGYELPTTYIHPAFVQRCEELGAKIVELHRDFLRENRITHVVSQLRAEGYTGVLLSDSSYTENEPEVEVVQKLGLPAVISAGEIKDAVSTGFKVLTTDDAVNWRNGLIYLTNSGYRNIAELLCFNAEDCSRGYCREEHIELLKSCGANSNPQWVKRCCNVSDLGGEADIERAIYELLNLNPRPEVIYCFSDFLALIVYRILRKEGLRIPEDVAVLGYCGFPGGALLSPPLATVDLGFSARGKLAAELLCAPRKWFIPGKNCGGAVILPGKILKRSSCSAMGSLINKPQSIALAEQERC